MYNQFYEAPYEDSEESEKFERQLAKMEYIEEEETWNSVPVAFATRKNLHVFLNASEYFLKVETRRDVLTGRGVIHVTIVHRDKMKKMVMDYAQVKRILQGQDQNPAKKFFATIASMIVKAFVNMETPSENKIETVITEPDIPETVQEELPEIIPEVVQRRVDEMVKKMTEQPIEQLKQKRKYTKRKK